MKISLVLAALFGGAMAGGAQARTDDCNVPMVDWQSRAAVQAMAVGQGWALRRIKTDDGCYEVYGHDANGRAIEARIDPGSLAIVEIEYEADHGDRAESDEHKSKDPNGLDD